MLKENDYHFPLSTAGIKRHIGEAGKASHHQAAAATAGPAQMTNGFAGHAGKLHSVRVLLNATPGAGESLAVDVLVGGVSVLAAGVPFVLDLTTATGLTWIELALDPDLVNINVGDVFTVDRTYIAGAGALANNTVEAHWA